MKWRPSLTLALVISAAAPALAAPGDPDPTFGPGGQGFVNVNFGLSLIADSVAVQKDGKTLVGCLVLDPQDQDLAVIRLNPDGSPDVGFGDQGIARVDLGGVLESLGGLAVQKDGRIVLCGSVGAPGNFDSAVARLLPNGSLDPAFGTQGMTVFDVGGNNFENCTSVALAKGGKIVVGGDAGFRFFVARFTARGQLDSRFGEGGIARPASSVFERGSAMVVLRNGKIVLGGRSGTGAASRMAFLQFLSNGTLDPRFGNQGRALIDVPGTDEDVSGLVLGKRGRIVGVGTVTSVATDLDIALGAVTSRGALDTGFGTQGTSVIDFFGQGQVGAAAAAEKSGRIVVGGAVALGGGLRASDLPPGGLVVRVLATGQADATFGEGGAVTTTAEGIQVGSGIALDRTGKIVLVGSASGGAGVARFLSR